MTVTATLLKVAGFEPPDNWCKSCEHHGSDHDLSNWCLVCPRPEIGKGEYYRSRADAGWCYFSSMSEDERWAFGMKVLERYG